MTIDRLREEFYGGEPMQISLSQKLFVTALTIGVVLSIYASVMAAQAPAAQQVAAVTYAQKGAAPTGPYPVVIEHDQKLATHTIYRPATLGPAKHSVLVWGEGGCAKNGLTFPEFLSEIASHGFVVVADGPPIARPAGAPPGAGGPPPGGGGRPPGGGAPP